MAQVVIILTVQHKNPLFCIVNTIVADDLETQETKASTAMVLKIYHGVLRFQQQVD